MNSKTARLLNKQALQFAIETNMPIKWAQKELKKLWKETPKNKLHTLGL
jgi:hypothetical protein